MVETVDDSLVYIMKGTDSAIGVGYLSNVAETPHILLVRGLAFVSPTDELYSDLCDQGWKMPEPVIVGDEEIETLPSRMYVQPLDGLHKIITDKDAIEVPKLLKGLPENYELPQIAIRRFRGDVCVRAVPPGTPLNVGW